MLSLLVEKDAAGNDLDESQQEHGAGVNLKCSEVAVLVIPRNRAVVT